MMLQSTANSLPTPPPFPPWIVPPQSVTQLEDIPRQFGAGCDNIRKTLAQPPGTVIKSRPIISSEGP